MWTQNKVSEPVARALEGKFPAHGLVWSTRPFYRSVSGKDAILCSNGSVTLIWLLQGTAAADLKHDISAVLEWCRIGTEACSCAGIGTCTAESTLHGGLIAGRCIDRRELEYALTPFEEAGYKKIALIPEQNYLFCAGENWFVLLNHRPVFLGGELQSYETGLESC